MLLLIVAIASVTLSQARRFTPVTTAMLQNPSPDDWLMYSRTYDAQRFSPLNQITKKTWPAETGMVEGHGDGHAGEHSTGSRWGDVRHESGCARLARQARYSGHWMPQTAISSGNTGGQDGGASNTKAFAMYLDLIFYPAGDSIVALDMRTGRFAGKPSRQ